MNGRERAGALANSVINTYDRHTAVEAILAFADEIRAEAAEAVRKEFKVAKGGSDTIDRACRAITGKESTL